MEWLLIFEMISLEGQSSAGSSSRARTYGQGSMKQADASALRAAQLRPRGRSTCREFWS
jgi:hypothetical protein